MAVMSGPDAAVAIRAVMERLGEEITVRHYAAHPDMLDRFGLTGQMRCREDARSHLQFLAAALDAESTAMFGDYVAWAKVMLASRGVGADDLAKNLRIVQEVIADALPDHAEVTAAYLGAALDALPSMPESVPTLLDPMRPLAPVANEYLRLVLAGKRVAAAALVMRAVDDGATARDIYRYILEPTQHEIGRLWQLNQITVAQEHLCSAATQQIMTQLYTRIFTGVSEGRRAVSMCVGGELHEIGLRMVTDMLELEGWQTWYLGANVPPAAAVAMCVEHQADVILISATLPPQIAAAAEVIRLVRASEPLANAKVIVGGRTFRMESDLWRRIGADAYAATADECLQIVEQLAGA